MSATPKSVLYAYLKERVVLLSFKTNRRYALIAHCTDLKVMNYLSKSIIFGKGPHSRTFGPKSVNVRGIESVTGDSQVIVAHPNNLVGWTPKIDYDFIIINFANIVSTASSYQGVYGPLFSIAPSWAQIIQAAGRAGRNENTGGFVFCESISLQTALRFSQTQIQDVHPILQGGV